MAEYGLIEPFESDDLQFCLGVEWEMFRQKLLTGRPFQTTVHSGNIDRLVRMCERHNRFVEVQPPLLVEGYSAEHFSEWKAMFIGGTKDAEEETPAA